jgi:hypothetical protein
VPPPSVALENLVFQRDQARHERDEYLAVIRRLVELDEAPRSIHYRRAWTSALEDAREAITNA